MKEIKKSFAEVRKLTLEDLSLCPKCFEVQGKPEEMVSCWVWGWIPDEDEDKPPVHYLREFNGKRLVPNNGVVLLGDEPGKPHIGLEHCLEMHQPGEEVIPYVKVDGDPEGSTSDLYTYELHGENPEILYRFSSRYARAVEADFLDVKYEYLPTALFCFKDSPMHASYIHQHCRITGTYEGKKVSFYGAFDRMFGDGWKEVFSPENIFVGLSFVGVCPDGRREWGFAGRTSLDGGGIAFYCKDGEEPVLSDHVDIDATWEPLPYATDSTMMCTAATYRFENVELHYKAKWGWRGQSYVPWTNPGLSQTSGEWYVGDTPYRHSEGFMYTENHNALKEQLIKAGLYYE